MPKALITDVAGLTISPQERAFLRDADPWGFILFKRNAATPEQVRALVTSMRDAVGRADAPVLIDQEGGRVQRLRARRMAEISAGRALRPDLRPRPGGGAGRRAARRAADRDPIWPRSASRSTACRSPTCR
jgi:beta-N-acetylhexosaminidase